VEEEMRELKDEIRSGKTRRIKEEMGDFLFTMAHLARHLEVDPEVALLAANRKFKKRFRQMEKKAKAQRRNLREMTSSQKERLWKEIKKAS